MGYHIYTAQTEYLYLLYINQNYMPSLILYYVIFYYHYIVIKKEH